MPAGVLQAIDLRFLDAQRVGRLGTVDDAGQVQLVPVCFARLGSRVYVPVDAKPKRGDPRDLARLRHLRARPHATLLVDQYEEDWRQLRWLMIRARATILEEGPERAAALASLEARYPQYVAMGLGGLGLPVIALAPTIVRRWAATTYLSPRPLGESPHLSPRPPREALHLSPRPLGEG